ncbi:MAG: hypothetical protein ABJB40_05725 [Acidobacteriota bacterium]
MAIQWDIFRGGQTVPSKERLSVSINAKNVLTLNRYTREILDRPEAVLVMFNKRDMMIGLSATHAGDPDSFEVKPKGGGANYVIHIAPFAEPGLTREGYLTLDLKRTINVSNRRKRIKR